MSNLSTLFDRYKALVVFDTETSGLDFDSDQIIELAALRVERTATGGLRIAGKVQNSHRAIDDVLALFEVLKAMDDEREDLGSYVNLFGYNPKYGVSGRRIVGVRYEPQSFSKGLTRPEQTLPARVARR